MSRTNYRALCRNLAYVDRALADATLSAARRAVLTEKRPYLLRALEGRCTLCGREISHPDSLAVGIGSECREKAKAS